MFLKMGVTETLINHPKWQHSLGKWCGQMWGILLSDKPISIGGSLVFVWPAISKLLEAERGNSGPSLSILE